MVKFENIFKDLFNPLFTRKTSKVVLVFKKRFTHFSVIKHLQDAKNI